MENNSWRNILPQKMSELRKNAGLTQAELAAKLNYSDKSISKWERGDGVPDMGVLVALADLYGVSLDELTGRISHVENKKPGAVNRVATLLIMSAAVWLAVTIAFVLLTLLAPDGWPCWKILVAALPVNCVLLGVCFTCWKQYGWAFGTLSAAIWTGCVSVHLCFVQSAPKLVYAAGALLQLSALITCGAIILHRHKK